jgi:hypothetical protein
MRRDDVIDVFNRIPEVEQTKVQLVMRSGPALSVETILRFEPTYLLMRGREAGNQDDGRAFFVPYDEITLLKIEASVKLAELESWYTDRPGRERKEAAKPVVPAAAIETPPPAAGLPLDPAEIAKRNLLDRIRAARTSAAARAAGR